MLKKPLLIVLSFVALAACGGGVDQPAVDEAVAEEAAVETPAKPVVLELAALLENTAEYVGTEISVSGTVDHVCKHGGKRLFIMGETPEMRFKITAGEAVGAFERELEGSTIRVTGIVEEEIIDEAAIDSLEAESHEEEAEEGHEEGAEEATDEHHPGEGDRAAHLRQALADSGSDQLSFYSLDCRAFEIIE